MGLMVEGDLLSWEETKAVSEHIRKHAGIQFYNRYFKHKLLSSDGMRWGDEIEYMLVKMNKASRCATLCLKGTSTLDVLHQRRIDDPKSCEIGEWQPEGAEYQLESIPAEPYTGSPDDISLVEKSMKLRREELQNALGPEELALTICAFPSLCSPDFAGQPHRPGANMHPDIYMSETFCNGTARVRTMTLHARERAVENFPIIQPLFVDKCSRFGRVNGEKQTTSCSISFLGMSPLLMHSSLHTTFLARDLDDARNMFDNFMVLAPIALSLSAACPFLCGYLVDHDSRWDFFSQQFDDRTAAERGIRVETGMAIPSRRGSPLSYITTQPHSHHDVQVDMYHSSYDYLIQEGMDEALAMYAAHVLTRDPLLAYADRLNLDDEQSTEHFENILTSVWHTVRLRIPSYDGGLGWRVEFRPCEIQLTDYENAAFATFNFLFTRIIRMFNLDLRIPISKVEANMKTAILNDSARRGLFFHKTAAEDLEEETVASMPINDIINGKEGVTTGLIPMMYSYLETISISRQARSVIHGHLTLISKKASGDILTTAQWLRSFVHKHPGYLQDSVVSDEIIYDLMTEIAEMASGNRKCPDLIPEM